MEIEFNILGPPELRVAGRKNVAVAPQLWCVLACLLLAEGVAVRAETLIGRLWGEHPPRKARETIRSYIWRIDRILAEVLGDAIRVRRMSGGYVLELEPDAVDVRRFHSLKRQADSLADSGEVRRAAELLREAEAVWRGEALAGLPGDWIGQVRHGLEEEHRIVVTRRIALELTMGRHAALLAELATLTEQYPLDEDIAEQRMLALFRAGRQADALRAYRETRHKLVALGLKPTPKLARLHERILRHDPELAITPVYRRVDRAVQPNTLPADTDDFTGRAEELRILTDEIGLGETQALRIVEGMGGVGKTALAVRAGRRMAPRYPDAQLYLNFRANEHHSGPLDPVEALGELLRMLDIPPIRIPDALAARAKLWREELAGRRVVLIFDDITGPEQIRWLLPGEGDNLTIVASREHHAGWDAARVLILHPLPEDEAAVLFGQIAGPAADQEPEHVARVSRWCGYLPLAIKVAASRLRSGAASSLSDLVDELDTPLGHPGPANEVVQRVHASLDLSYRRLSAEQQHFFRCLSISPCLDLTEHSAASLAHMTLAESRAALTALAAHHLLEEVAPSRFGFHDVLRAFAAARFADEESASEGRRGVARLADYYLKAVSYAGEVRRASGPQTLPSGGMPEPIPFDATPEAAGTWLESEWANVLRVAEQCAKHEFKRRCAELVHVLGGFLVTSGHWDDALTAYLMALRACREIDDIPGMARSALSLSNVYLRTGHNETALQHATDALDIFASLGDNLGRASALDRIGFIHCNLARFRQALAYHQEALDIYRADGDVHGLGKALVNAGIALGYLGRLQEEMSYLSQALEIYRENSDLRNQAAAVNNIGTIQYYQGFYRDAMRSYQTSWDISVRIGDRRQLTLVAHNMARVQQYVGNYDAAITTFKEVLVTYRSLGDPQHQAYALADIGTVYQNTDRSDEALAHYERSAAMAEKARDLYAYAEAICGTADVHFGSGRIDVALKSYEQVAKLASEIESPYLKAKALRGIAESSLHTEGADAARIYWREAYDIFSQIGTLEAATVELRLHTA